MAARRSYLPTDEELFAGMSEAEREAFYRQVQESVDAGPNYDEDPHWNCGNDPYFRATRGGK